MGRHSLELLAALVVVLCSALPAAHAAEKFEVLVNPSPIELRLASGEIVQAQFESLVIVSTNGEAQGNMTFTFFARDIVLSYRVVAARVVFDAAGEILRVWLSLVTQSDGGDQRGFAIAVISDDLIYDILGPDVHDEPATFHVEGTITKLKLR